VAGGAVAARVGLAALRAATERGPGLPAPDPPSWARTNYRGRTVSLAGGPALAGAAALAAAAGAPGRASAAAVLAAGLGSGAVGLYDDLVGGRAEHRAKGFHGHLAALRRGRVTSGVAKLAGIGAAGLAAAALLPPPRPASAAASAFPPTASRSWTRRATRRAGRSKNSMLDIVVGAGVIAGAANLLNLLDLRPGRALKVGLLVGAPLAAGGAGGLAAGPAGAAAALLPEDLAERTMLGDCGANALGAVLGTALVARTGPAGRAVALAVIAGLTAASERVSFTQVIARTPGLRELDQLGRGRPDPDPTAGSPRR
jgi:hypothetical protein